jgi:hypothetical protein
MNTPQQNDIQNDIRNNKDIILAYVKAIEAQDFRIARAMLSDRNFLYVGPNMQFSDPDEMLTFMFSMAPILKDIDTRRIIGEGNEVCMMVDYKTFFEPIGDVRVALWAQIEAGKIQRLEVFYNAAVVENMLAVDGQLPFSG